MYSVDDYKDMIASALLHAELIDRNLYIKCSPYISELPGDLRSADIPELMERMDSIDSEITRRNDMLDKAEYRLGVKSRDNEKITKRLNKANDKMEKAVDNINGESDKIVKGIEKLEKKLDKLDLSDPSDKSLKDSIKSRLDKFKKAHNNFFEKDLTQKNIIGYRSELGTLDARATDLHNILVDLHNGGMITKTDLNNGDISKNLARISKNIDNFEKASKDMQKDMQKIDDNFGDMDYLIRQSDKVKNEIEVLNDEYDHTLNIYLDKGGDKSIKPGFDQSGHGTDIDSFNDEMKKLQKELGRTFDGFPS